MKDKYKEISRISKETLNREIKVHDFDEILDVGFKNLLYLVIHKIRILFNHFQKNLKMIVKFI